MGLVYHSTFLVHFAMLAPIFTFISFSYIYPWRIRLPWVPGTSSHNLRAISWRDPTWNLSFFVVRISIHDTVQFIKKSLYKSLRAKLYHKPWIRTTNHEVGPWKMAFFHGLTFMVCFHKRSIHKAFGALSRCKSNVDQEEWPWIIKKMYC